MFHNFHFFLSDGKKMSVQTQSNIFRALKEAQLDPKKEKLSFYSTDEEHEFAFDHNSKKWISKNANPVLFLELKEKAEKLQLIM